MSRGLEAVYRLLVIKDDKAIYAYSGENFSFPYDKDFARSYNGRIKVLLSAFDDIDSYDLFKKGKVKVIKECHYAEKNLYGVDILAIKTVNNILKKYRETCEIPKEGHLIV